MEQNFTDSTGAEVDPEAASMERSVLREWRFQVVLAVSLAALVYLFFAVRSLTAQGSPVDSGASRAEIVQGPKGFVVKSIRPPRPGQTEEVPRAGLAVGDIVVGVISSHNRRVEFKGLYSGAEVRRAVHYGEPWTLVVRRQGQDGAWSEVNLPVAATKAPARQVSFYTVAGMGLTLLFPLVCIATALLIAYMKPGDPFAFNASLLFLSAMSLVWPVTFRLFPPVGRELGLLLYIVLFSNLTGLFLRFFLLFPSPSALYRKAPWLTKAGIAVGLVFSAWNFNWHSIEGYSTQTFMAFTEWAYWIDRPLDGLYVGLFLVGIASLATNVIQLKAPDERRRLAIVLVGSLGFLPPFTTYLLRVLGIAGDFPRWIGIVVTVTALAFPLCFAWAVVRYRLFGVKVILRKGLQFALLSRGFLFLEGVLLFLVLYYVSVPVLGKAVEAVAPGALAVVTAIVTMGVLIGVKRLNGQVMHRIERRFFREAYDARRILTELSLKLRRMALDPDTLISTVTSTVMEALHPDRAGLFLRGTEIARTPFKVELQDHFRLMDREEARAFFCLWHRTTDQANGHPTRATWPANEVIVLPDSHVSKRLEEEVGGTPDAVEVRLNDRRSWSRGLMEDGAEAERNVVTRCHMNLLVPLASGSRLMGFLSMGEKLSEEPYSHEDRELLVAVAQQLTDTLEHAQLLKEGQEQAIYKREMEIAKEVQERLFPHHGMELASLDYAGMCKPAREVGGDYYDFLPVGERRLAIALGDVSGKGVSAALLMANLQAMLRVHAQAHGPQAAEVVKDINGLLCSATDQARFATLFYGVYDADARTLCYVNAGHNPPMVFRRSTDNGTTVIRLKSTGTVLGIFPGTQYRQEMVQLQPGDLMLLFSDGVTEAMDATQDFFGDQRLEDLVKDELMNLCASDVRDRVLNAVERFSAGRPQADDITLIAARVVA